MSNTSPYVQWPKGYRKSYTVYCDVSYAVFDMGGFFKQLKDFIGHFRIEQTMEQSLNHCFRLWFDTDKVEIFEGDSRQVVVECNSNAQGLIYFTIKKV